MATAILDRKQPRAGSSERFYRPELDLLRFFAFMMVFFSHILPASSHAMRVGKQAGALGVPVFFTLSAYLITELLLIEKAKTGQVNIRSFYVRRILRIWPLYFLILFGVSVLSFVVPGQSHITIAQLTAFLLMSGNWYTIFGSGLPLAGSVLWSISVEEQFYLVWPHVTRFANHVSMAVIAAILWLISQTGLIVICTKHPWIHPAVWYNSFTHLQYFAIGIVIAVFLHRRTVAINSALRLLMIGFGIGLFIIANDPFNSVMPDFASVVRTWPGYMIAGLGSSLMLVGILGTKLPSFLKPFVYFGKISFGLYVYHGLILMATIYIATRYFHAQAHLYLWRIGLGLPLTIAISFLSYRYFEKRFLHLKERFEVVKSRPA